MAEAGEAEAGREAGRRLGWRDAVGIACVATLHLGALYALLTTEYGPFAITLSLLAWLFANCLILVFLPRPGIAAALFHVWSNGWTKGALFLSAGNLRRAAGSPSMFPKLP